VHTQFEQRVKFNIFLCFFFAKPQPTTLYSSEKHAAKLFSLVLCSSLREEKNFLWRGPNVFAVCAVLLSLIWHFMFSLIREYKPTTSIRGLWRCRSKFNKFFVNRQKLACPRERKNSFHLLAHNWNRKCLFVSFFIACESNIRNETAQWNCHEELSFDYS
jgi:hypothetical protein